MKNRIKKMIWSRRVKTNSRNPLITTNVLINSWVMGKNWLLGQNMTHPGSVKAAVWCKAYSVQLWMLTRQLSLRTEEAVHVQEAAPGPPFRRLLDRFLSSSMIDLTDVRSVGLIKRVCFFFLFHNVSIISTFVSLPFCCICFCIPAILSHCLFFLCQCQTLFI